MTTIQKMVTMILEMRAMRIDRMTVMILILIKRQTSKRSQKKRDKKSKWIQTIIFPSLTILIMTRS